MKLPFRKALDGIKAYDTGKPAEIVRQEYGLDHVDKLASNENPLNCSRRAIEAVREAAADLSTYPDGNATELKKAIANFYGVKETEIMVTCGSDEMISMIGEVFLDPGDETIMADITFSSYIIAAKTAGAKIVTVPIKDFKLSLDKTAEAITNKTKLIWLCNPNNPTGTIFTEAELIDFMANVPKTVAVVYDEAYVEYVTDPGYPKDGFRLYKRYPNMIVMRTFSKVYGLAGLRVGYSFAHEEIIRNVNKIKRAFNVNRLAQVAAVAALRDREFVKRVIAVNTEGKKYLYRCFDEMGIEYVPTQANYIYFDAGRDCNEVFANMQRRGIIIRPIKDTFVRVTIGTMKQNERFIEILKEVLAK